MFAVIKPLKFFAGVGIGPPNNVWPNLRSRLNLSLTATHFRGVLAVGGLGISGSALLAEPPTNTLSESNVFRRATPLAVNDALQAAMLLPKSALLPDLRPTALDEILAVRVLVNPQVDDLFGPVPSTVPLNEAINRRLDTSSDRRLIV